MNLNPTIMIPETFHRPQLNGKYFLTDGGLETTLIFHQGIDLPHFASFELLNQPEGAEILREYYLRYLEIAKKNDFGFVLESPTWRASKDWGYIMGYDDNSLEQINNVAIEQLLQIKEDFESKDFPIVVSGCIGPRADGYTPGNKMSANEAREYHQIQINSLKRAGAEVITSFTINYAEEAIGIALAALECQIPVIIGMTVETDGRLPAGSTLQKTIELIDRSTGDYPLYYMINCAHPSHFKNVLNEDSSWKRRILAIRANASMKSHAELNESEHLDAGDACELASQYQELRKLLPNLKVVGGCCGTDHSHIEEICKHWNK